MISVSCYAFWYMGGYAAYVWPAFGSALLLLSTLLWQALRDYQRLLRQLRAGNAKRNALHASHS